MTSEPLNQYTEICRDAIKSSSAKLSKTFKPRLLNYHFNCLALVAIGEGKEAEASGHVGRHKEGAVGAEVALLHQDARGSHGPHGDVGGIDAAQVKTNDVATHGGRRHDMDLLLLLAGALHGLDACAALTRTA